MPDDPLRFAVVGCGNISGPYGETAKAYPSVEIAGATDVDPALSAAFVERFGGVDYPSLEALLADPDGRRRRQPDVARCPRPGHRCRARGRQARSQREADGRELRGGPQRWSSSRMRRACASRARRSRSWVMPRRPPGASSTPVRSGRSASSTRRSTGAASRHGIRAPLRSTGSGRWPTSASTRSPS